MKSSVVYDKAIELFEQECAYVPQDWDWFVYKFMLWLHEEYGLEAMESENAPDIRGSRDADAEGSSAAR